MLSSEDYLKFLNKQKHTDAAHDIEHVKRVVRSADYLCRQEGADWFVLEPAAWLHDCVQLPKDSPHRKQASKLAADRASVFLERYLEPDIVEAIAHCIHAHSFSAGVKPETLEASILQDADRLDAIGAIGIARCLITGAGFDAELYNPDSPEPSERPPDEKRYIVDHFYTKLLTLEKTMNTEAARKEAKHRTTVMQNWLDELYREIAGGIG